MAESSNMIFKLNNSNIFYEGNLRFGRLEGNGKLMLNMIDEETAKQTEIINNTLYKGEFKNNKVNGKGILYYSDGYRFEGNFSDGVSNGYGKLFKNNNVIKEGVWINGLVN